MEQSNLNIPNTVNITEKESLIQELMTEVPNKEVPSIFDAASPMTENQEKMMTDLSTAMQDNVITGGQSQVGGQNMILEQLSRYRKTKPLTREHKVGRNDLCPCGSGRKYKHCCLESGTYEQLV